jgi:hypothetical protein
MRSWLTRGTLGFLVVSMLSLSGCMKCKPAARMSYGSTPGYHSVSTGLTTPMGPLLST